MRNARRKASRGQCLPEVAAQPGLLLVLLLTPVGLDFEQIWVQTLLGMLATAAIVLVIAWRKHRKTIEGLQAELRRALEQARNSNRERDQAQGELLLRLDQERELNKQKMQLQAQLADYEKYAALAQMALGAAHEINNPLLGILSHLELELKVASPEAHTEIEQCIESAKRISATTRGLLNYTRPDPVRVSRIQLGPLTGELLSFLQHQPLLRALRVENRVTSEVPAIYADSQQLSQVLMNVLLNAAEATPAGGSIRVEAQALPATKGVEIRVTDTGSGIPADILPHIFEPFFTTKRGKGTGLGLSISQAYIRRHGGEISVESAQAEGTTVRITLPIRGQAALCAEEENTEVVV
jgi:signal transduction histidine kinase